MASFKINIIEKKKKFFIFHFGLLLNIIILQIIKYDRTAKEEIHREIYLEKLRAVSQDNNESFNYPSFTETKQNGKHWDKLAKTIKKVNHTSLITDDKITEGLKKSREAKNQNAPVDGILIDFEDENSKGRSNENCLY